METIKRHLDLRPILKAKSCFLLGPRQTGKTSLLEAQLPDATRIDLLDDEIFLRLQAKPTMLRDYIKHSGQVVVIDEIQRVPPLLNEVHRLIESDKSIRFVLTGSSARKLRKKGVNLLGGRARSRRLHPFVWAELQGSKIGFDLPRSLLYGSIPSIVYSDAPRDDLKSYVGDYLKEEIAMEAATRNLPAFSRFLETAAHCNGQILNFQKIGNDAQVKRSTAQNYFELLRDTLLGSDLPAYKKTRSRKATTTSKFYFFDLGVVQYLRGVRDLAKGTPLFGEAFEAYIHHELASWCDYHSDHELSYWRSQDGRHEVDFIINGDVAIECKSTHAVDAGDIKGLNAFALETTLRHRIIVCFEPRPRRVSGIEILPWAHFLEKLWSGDLIR